MSHQESMKDVMRMMDAVQRAKDTQQDAHLPDASVLARMRMLCENQGLTVDDSILSRAFEELYGRPVHDMVPAASTVDPVVLPPASVVRERKRRWWLSLDLWLGIAILMSISMLQVSRTKMKQESQKNEQGMHLLSQALTELRLISSQGQETRLAALKKNPRNDLNLWGGRASVQRLAPGGYRVEYTNLPAMSCLLLAGNSKNQLANVRVTHGTVTTDVMPSPGVIQSEALVAACNAEGPISLVLDTRSLGGLED